jgi:hypothetical protein
MAKISLTKITPVKELKAKIVTIGEIDIEVKQYLPLKEKIEIASVVTGMSTGDMGINPIQRDVLTKFYILDYYTNINFTDKQKEDIEKTFDLLEINDVINRVLEAIPASEIDTVMSWVFICSNTFENYRNSIRGIIEDIVSKYGSTELDIEKLVSQIKDPEVGEFLKNLSNVG